MSATHPIPTAPPAAPTAPPSATHVAWVFELSVREGREAAFRTLMDEMVAATEAGELGTLDYEWYLTEDGRRVHILERYADPAAAMAHLATFGARYMGRFFDALIPERMTVYGAADDAVRGALAQLSPAALRRAAGFRR